MSRGSLLARNVDPEQLRSLVTEAVQATRDNFALSKDVATRLDELSAELQKIVPGTGDLDLAMLTPRGQNLLGMIGLFAKRGEVAVPLANAGLGTQQLTLFTLARLLINGFALFVIDEIESGLEPFRQRDLVARLRQTIGADGQAFITTHSPAVIGELAVGELHRLSPTGGGACVVAVMPKGLERMRREDPEALLCRLPSVVEGQTELGLLEVLLEEQAAQAGTTLGALGIRLVDGGGQPKLFKVTDALRSANQRFAAFLDSETTSKGKREELRAAPHVGLGTYRDARCLEEALSKQLSLTELDRLIATPGANGRDNSQARYHQLNELAGTPGRNTLVELAVTHGERRCRELFSEVANRSSWFKTRQDSIVVGRFLLEHHPTVQIVRDVNAFWKAIMGQLGDELPLEGLSDPHSRAGAPS